MKVSPPELLSPISRLRIVVYLFKILAISLFGLCSSLAQPEILTGHVVKIADGNTLTLLDASKQQHSRLTGIDAPERKQAFGTVSKQHLAELVFGMVDVE